MWRHITVDNMSLVLLILSISLFNTGAIEILLTNGPASKNIYNPDFVLNTPQIIKRHGYPAETHIVQTDDGYLLSVHRIPGNRNGRVGLQPIFLQHGLIQSSIVWILIGDNSLAFILSDLGYDVWIGNSRGNPDSKAHISLDPNNRVDSSFWEHSFHEMGKYDLPAVFAYIENKTNTLGEIIYVGHSMGTTMFFAYASTMPELAKKSVKAMVALGPIAFMKDIKTPLALIGRNHVDDLLWSFEYLKSYEFTPTVWLMNELSKACRVSDFQNTVCENVVLLICGYNSKRFDKNVFDLLVAHNAFKVATKTIIHYGQEIRDSGIFQNYDHGEKKNLKKYGTVKPPLYNISNINIPVHLVYSEYDWLGTPHNVEHLESLIGNKYASLYKVGHEEEFNHMDFIWAKDADQLVYYDLIRFIEQYRIY